MTAEQNIVIILSVLFLATLIILILITRRALEYLDEILKLNDKISTIPAKTATEILSNIGDKYLYLKEDGKFTRVSDCKWYKELCAKYGIAFINETEDKIK